MINLGFNAAGEQVQTSLSTQSESEEVLRQEHPNIVDIVPMTHGEVIQRRRPFTLVNGVVIDAPAPTPDEIEAARKARLVNYTEEKGLKLGATILDPVTDEPASDPNSSIDTIRKETGQSRSRLVYLKRNGDTNGKAKANKAQKVEEDLSEEVGQTIIDIAADIVTTEAQVDTRLEAIDLTY